jgi:hypothetical protein
MAVIQTLSDLNNTLINAISNGVLVLVKDLTQVGGIDNFIGSLPGQQIRLINPQIDFQDRASPPKLTLTGSISDSWKLKGLTGDGVQISGARLVFTQAQAGSMITGELFIDGAFTISSNTIALAGVLTASNSVQFTQKTQNAVSLPLLDIVNFMSDSRMGDSLPTGVAIFDNVPVTVLGVTLGYGSSEFAALSFTTDTNSDWEIITGLVSLKKVGVTLNANYSPGSLGRVRNAFSGNIHATFNIGRDFSVVLALRTRDFWELEIIPANGNILPTLADLATLAGGNDLQNSVKAGIDNIGLGEIALDSVRIGVNLGARTLSYVRIDGHIQFAGKAANIQVQLPDFQFGGSLSKDTPISLKEIITHYFGAADNFPEVNIAELDISAQPSISYYGVHGSIESEELRFGPIALNQVTFDIEKSSNSLSGAIAAAFRIADTDIFISAANPGSNAGWEFKGGTGPGQQIPIGKLITDLAGKFGDVTLPPVIEGLVIQNLGASFNTKSGDFLVTCESKFPVDGKEFDITITISSTKSGSTYKTDFGGHITIGTLKFDLNFIKGNTSSILVAAYHQSGDNQRIQVKSLVANISSQIADNIPASLEVELKDVLFAFSKDATGSAFLFGLDIGASINLSNLPLVGKEFPPDQTVGVDDLQLLVASRAFTLAEANAFNALIPTGVTRLPVQPQSTTDGTNQTTQTAIQRGLNVAAQMKFGSATQTLSLPVASSTQATGAGQPATATATGSTALVASSDNAKWFTLQKNFGPVHFERVGVQYQDAVLWFLLDGSLTFAGLTLSLDGLSVGSPLSKFEPKFNLRGIGIDYRSGSLEIAGAFLRKQVQSGGQTYDEYDGAALIKTQQFALSAIGSYAYYNGHPSLFIYGVLDYPIGGPSFFFITGLAAGFGYNRSLVMPAIEQVGQFPLVAQAVSGPRATKNLDEELRSVSQYIPPSVGQIFLAVGIKFTSFKVVDSFALLTISFGARFELNLLGLSTLVSPPVSPPNVPPLAVVQMAIRAAFIPDEGFLGIQGQLTPASFIFTRDCHITGGFAFFCWFKGEHAGDFVVTIGGYHLSYSAPSHYPRVPRVGISWQVDANLSIKGEAYFALTSSALMAGGALQAVWQSGNFKAWFNAGADFLIAWKPYHYDVHIYVNMGVSYTFSVFGFRKTISVDIGADLHIWGPEFSGTAHIKLWIVSFDVAFGAGSSQLPAPIGWDEFKKSFLPEKPDKTGAEVCGITIKDGLVKQSDKNLWIVNPKYFCLVTDSVIPSKEAYKRDTRLTVTNLPQFGVGPMAVASGNLSSTHTIKITRNGTEAADNDFDFAPVLKRAPAGLWGQSVTPSLNGQAFVESALSGFEIRPKGQPAAGETRDIDCANLSDSAETIGAAYRWESFESFTPVSGSDEQRRAMMRPGITDQGKILLSNLGLNRIEITVSDSTINAFLIAPQIGPIVPWP